MTRWPPTQFDVRPRPAGGLEIEASFPTAAAIDGPVPGPQLAREYALAE